MTGWVYILQLSNGLFYVGSTTNLQNRISDHQHGKSRYTSKFLPVNLLFSQEFPTYLLARRAETWLKSLKDKQLLNRIIAEGKISKEFK